MPAPDAIFHISTAAGWAAAQAAGSYTAPSLGQEGFLHLSTAGQVSGSARRHYAGRTDLVLLVVDPGALGAQLRWEQSSHASDPFPHLYGPLNLDAVRAVVPFGPGADGSFPLPAGL